MQHSTTSVIVRAKSPKMSSAVVTFLLSALFLALCEYGNGFKLTIIYNLEILIYCAYLAFIFTSKFVV
jgi:hypothetical protein